jgi:dipicolinate synthase subunit A
MGGVAAVEIRDKRDKYIVEGLEKAGFAVVGLDTLTQLNAITERLIVVRSLLSDITEDFAAGVPEGAWLFGRGINDKVKEMCRARNITYRNILENETFIVKNAYLTAEGALAYVILNTESTIRQMPVLVMGYGRVGKSVTKLLKDNYSIVSVATDDPTEYAIASIFSDNVYTLEGGKEHISEFSAVINTVPKLILEEDTLRHADQSCFFLDLASAPGGIDPGAAVALGLKFLHAQGVPGKVCPKTAGMYIKDVILMCLART